MPPVMNPLRPTTLPWLRRWGALLLTALLIVAPARRTFAGPFGQLLGLQESSRLAKAYAVLHESFYPTSVAWSPGGPYIADTGLFVETIHIWNADTRQVVQSLQTRGSGIDYQSLAWSPEGRYLAACGASRLQVWDSSTWTSVSDQPSHRGCGSLAFSGDGRWLAVSSPGTNGDTCVYSTQDWALKQCTNFEALPGFHGFGFDTAKVAFQPGTDVLAIATGGWYHDPRIPYTVSTPETGRVLFWDVNGPPPDLAHGGLDDSIEAYPAPGGMPVVGLAYSPDGRQLATGEWGRTSTHPGNTTEIWDVATHQLLGTPLGQRIDNAGENNALIYTTDGRYLLSVFEDKQGTIDFIDSRMLQLVDTVHTFALGANAIAIEPHGNRFVVTAPNKLLVWSMNSKP